MLLINNSKKTFIFYDAMGEKCVIYPNGKVEDTVIPEVINIDGFIPYGVKRTPTKIKDIENGTK